MKLEPLNGNILPIVKVVQEQKIDGEPKEGHDDEELPEVMDEEEASDGKKKKQTRKKRSLNWEEAERGLLLEVIKPKVDYVENRNVDAKSIKAKRLAWLQITKQFNALNFRHRSLEQIQVQWRSMKNTAKREYQTKHPKGCVPDGMELLDFMEEMQKDPISTRSQVRSTGVGGIVIKKEENDIDEDTPLAALPTASDEALLQAQATVTLPSPPPSAESQNDSQHLVTPARNSKKKISPQKSQQPQQTSQANKPKRLKSQNSVQSLDTALAPVTASRATATTSAAGAAVVVNVDDNYKKDLFELMKRARLAEMDYVRREHEQKLRLQQMEQDLKLSYYRKQEELKLHQMRQEHETRMQHLKLEHEARMKAYATRTCSRNLKSAEIHNSTSSNLNMETDPN